MTPARNDLVIRPPAGPQELELFRGLHYCLDHELAEDLADGRRRPEWMWVALRDGRLEARAAWRGGAGNAVPSLLDFLDVGDAPDRAAIGGSLLRAALSEIMTAPGAAPEYVRFVCPARNDYGAIIAYLGVLPAHRGHGYIDEILAAGTRVLAAQDVPRIRATTDLGNAPMAAAFTRAGWVNFENSINMVWD